MASHSVTRAPAGVARAQRRRPWSAPLAVVLVLLGIFATGAGLGRTAGPFDWVETTGVTGTAQPARSRQPASRPVSLSVPAINVSAPVTPVGQAKDGSVDVPPLSQHDQTGWYDRGPVPGEPGRAIIVGHVDTKSGPAVFYRLRDLKPGDRIEVTRADRSVVTFKVDTVEYFDKADLPADRVYGEGGPPGLRLITCGGQWVGGRTGYADNVITFASLVDTREP
ncbi:class F sortase [Micromonospora eburnea]|uniref:LPXTG-site transpeptidase (Sortase) family protein n=1 Tax=Micromonospora eburnea TaxID=227316 RepID=A0A1C6U4H7_9ACTN|nr:class F sortase [Micromonospora eburnea]SCL48927.1 LPXTG-site transpeptidase (sortase) family protein [Micromonospora eburnea]